jgi:hypothetical protein
VAYFNVFLQLAPRNSSQANRPSTPAAIPSAVFLNVLNYRPRIKHTSVIRTVVLLFVVLKSFLTINIKDALTSALRVAMSLTFPMNTLSLALCTLTRGEVLNVVTAVGMNAHAWACTWPNDIGVSTHGLYNGDICLPTV